MSMTQRILLSILVLLVDLFIFFLPLSAIFLGYILIFNPPWFRELLNKTSHTDNSA